MDLYHTETVSVIHRYRWATVMHKIAVHELLVPKKSWLELMCSKGISQWSILPHSLLWLEERIKAREKEENLYIYKDVKHGLISTSY